VLSASAFLSLIELRFLLLFEASCIPDVHCILAAKQREYAYQVISHGNSWCTVGKNLLFIHFAIGICYVCIYYLFFTART
jgi:hypothetical protein